MFSRKCEILKKAFFAFYFFGVLNSVFSQRIPDALKHFSNGRDLDYVGRTTEAISEYSRAIKICQDQLEVEPNNMDSYAVYTWSLFRLKKYAETVSVCRQALNIRNDVRIIETMGEALFYLNKLDESLVQMQKYISLAPTGERIAVAYFFEAEIYRIKKQYNKAEIAYTATVFIEPGNSLWWYRLGLTREILNNRAGAIEAYTRAVRLAPNYVEAINALKRLRG